MTHTTHARPIPRRRFLQAAAAAGVGAALGPLAFGQSTQPYDRPNILFAIGDDWSWPHAFGLPDPNVKTPTYDRLCREGVRFTRAFVAAPTCTASRGAILTGQHPWRLENGMNLHSTLPARFAVYPDLLEAAGYHVGFTRKGWGPGNVNAGGRKRNPAGPSFKDFAAFFQARPAGKPFCFWFGSYEPHRSYDRGAGVRRGMDPKTVAVPKCLPDAPAVRSDLCDYYSEVETYDRDLGQILAQIEAAGELDNTIVVMTGDNGIPFPRAKATLYDMGTHVPLGIRWPRRVKGGRTVDDFVTLPDVAPTFLEAAGLRPPAEMTGRSLLSVLLSDRQGQVDPARDHVLTAKERHTCCQAEGTGGTPMRALRNADYLYIRNFAPDRWPAGVPGGFRDIDGGPSKQYLLDHRTDPGADRLFALATARRPAEELYDLKKDPDQFENVAGRPEYADIQAKLSAQLMDELKTTRDPRAEGKGDIFDTYEYYGDRPDPKKPQ